MRFLHVKICLELFQSCTMINKIIRFTLPSIIIVVCLCMLCA